MTNPATPDFYLLGVYDQYLAEPIAHVLKSLGAKRALVVYGEDKLDEISVSSETFVAELKEDGTITTYEIKPEDFGFTSDLREEQRKISSAVLPKRMHRLQEAFSKERSLM